MSAATAATPAPSEMCCPHRAADHKGSENKYQSEGQPCTIPGCRCAGWKSRKNGKRAARRQR